MAALTTRRYIAEFVGVEDGTPIYAVECAMFAAGMRFVMNNEGVEDSTPIYALGNCETLTTGKYIGRFTGVEDNTPIYVVDCCAGTTCLLGEDDFNRANENPVTGLWTEVSGDWRVQTNTLEGLTPGLFLTSIRQEAPVRANAGYTNIMSITIDSTGGYSEWHIVCNVTDANNYYWIKISLDGGYYWPAFYIRTGGADTLIMDKTTHPRTSGWLLEAGILRMKLCMSDIEWSIEPVGAQGGLRWQTCTGEPVKALPSNATYGLVGVKQGRFDDFRYEIHWESRTDCAYCNCICYNGVDDVRCIAEELTVTMIPRSGPYNWGFGECAAPGMISFKMFQQDPITAAYPTLPVFGLDRRTPKKFIWYSELIRGENAGTPPIHGGVGWFLLVCDSARSRVYLAVLEYNNVNLSSYTALVSAGSPNWSSVDDPPCNAAKYFDLAESSCDPFTLSFKGLQFPRGAVGQCDINGTLYDVIITESASGSSSSARPLSPIAKPVRIFRGL